MTAEKHEFTLHYLPTPKREDLTIEQERHWYHELEVAERKVEYAKRMLGLLAIENGLEG